MLKWSPSGGLECPDGPRGEGGGGGGAAPAPVLPLDLTPEARGLLALVSE